MANRIQAAMVAGLSGGWNFFKRARTRAKQKRNPEVERKAALKRKRKQAQSVARLLKQKSKTRGLLKQIFNKGGYFDPNTPAILDNTTIDGAGQLPGEGGFFGAKEDIDSLVAGMDLADKPDVSGAQVRDAWDRPGPSQKPENE